VSRGEFWFLIVAALIYTAVMWEALTYGLAHTR